MTPCRLPEMNVRRLLVLGASAMLHGGNEITIGLAYGVANSSLVAVMFAVFVAQHEGLRTHGRAIVERHGGA